MRVAYLDCSTGISGDMTLAALVDAGVEAEAIRRGVTSLDLPGVELSFDRVMKGGFRATRVRIAHPEQHAHRHYSDIQAILQNASGLSDGQRALADEIFLAVAGAEATVHGSTLEKIHFHEVGAIDSIVDIVGVAIGFDLLGVDRVEASFIPTGQGRIRIDHGVCTVPAPGTAELLKGIPLCHVPIEAELTTPTGAAFLSVLVDRFGPLPEMTIEQIGYGAGTLDFPERANLLRLFVGETRERPNIEYISLLETNLDDVSGEVIGHTRQRLMQQGALDVFTSPIQMKKDRPGTLLAVLCRPEDRDAIEQTIYAETGTLGIRRSVIERTVRSRRSHVVETVYGPVQGKVAGGRGDVESFTPEYEDCARLAASCGQPLRTIYRAAEVAFGNSKPNPVQGTSAGSEHHHDHDSHTHDHDGHRHDHDHDHDG